MMTPPADAYREPLLAAAALARRLPCSPTRGALAEAVERAVTAAASPHATTYRAAVDLLYDSLLGQRRPTAHYAASLNISDAALNNIAMRLRRLGLPVCKGVRHAR